ncbi:MAG: carboxylesterase/lipase family protein [Candidatus Lokiarchaeota archaeon]|nr:carboxylesterase/lipase family protein [Candidatus Lokiarchaeota archaeon]
MKTIIETRLGQVIGLQYEGYQEYLGLRYAQPPVENSRYEPPVLITSWEIPYDATKVGPIAPQAHEDDPPINLEENEDCLFLNIWTPNADEVKRPVMVYIHGGAFVIGSASRPRIHGGKLSKRGNVVVVNIQYRLGMLGFLNFKGISPNLGLQDQICALQWIQENIKSFGGDPNNVTVFGESAGAMSLGLLMLSPKASGLFHKGIAQSGAIDFDHMETDLKNSQNSARKFLNRLKIDPIDSRILKTLPIEKLIQAERNTMKGSFLIDRLFFPFPDRNIIPFDYEKAWKTGHARKIPLLIGMNAEELPLFSTNLIPSKLKQFIAKFFIMRGIRKVTGFSKHQFEELIRVYKKNYHPPDYPKNAEYDMLLTDIAFWLFTNKQAELHSSIQDTYMYVLNYKAPKINASPHVFDLLFVFGNLTSKDVAEGIRLEGTAIEQHLREQIMDAWISFAQNGDPNHKELPNWPKFDTIKRYTMIFDSPCNIIENPKEEIRLVWKNLVT